MPPAKKLCMVCGDKALGYNFNAVTCESCKAFFRRNALSNKKFTCPFSENCEITVITRRFCQRCRLEKCFRIGMKKEHIMSEEDKILKKKKIEQNRAKRKLLTLNKDDKKSKIKREISSEDVNNCDDELWPSTEKIKRNYSDSSSYGRESPCDFSSTSLSCESYRIESINNNNDNGNGNKDCPFSVCNTSSAKDIVNSIVNRPETASQIINHIMRTPKEAVDVISKIINSQPEALRFISHLVLYPGDALKIISKIMNSPLDALTVFTKFMSSPNDSLQIISRIVNSPADVLQFMQQLMRSPEDASNIMEKFMNTPAEALKIINNMVNSSNVDNKSNENIELDIDNNNENTKTNINTNTVYNTNNSMIDSMLNEIQSPESSVPSSPDTNTRSDGIIGTTIPKCMPLPTLSSSSPIHPPQHLPSSMSSTFTTKNYTSVASSSNSYNISTNNKSNFIDIGDIAFSLSGKRDQMKNILEDVEDRPIPPNSIESVLCEAIKLEYETYNSLPQSVGDNRELNEAEKAKLNELLQANKALYYPVDEDLSNIINDERIKCEGSQHDPKLLHLINLTAVAIRRLIKMSKKINAFRNMCQEDQVALLKGGCTEMMIMRSVMSYDHNQATWKIPHSKEDMSNIRVDVLKLAKGKVYDEHERFIRTFDPKWRTDENIILIMCAIVLFTPSRPRVIHSDVIKLEQNSYYYLLRRYLETVYSGCEAKSTFIKLIQKVSEVSKLNEVFINVYLNVNPSHIEPLLREIFDMKNH